MSTGLEIKGKLPDKIEQKYEELLDQAIHPSKKRSLTAVRNALVVLIADGDTEFKYTDVGKASFDNDKGPKAGTISNTTSLHLQALIEFAREHVEKKPVGKSNLSEVDKFTAEIVPLMRDPALRKKFNILMHELKALRNELNILKGNYHADKTPLQFVLPATESSGPAISSLTVHSLTPNHIKTIRTFANNLGDKLGGSGLYKNKYGALEDVEGNEVAGVGFIDALEKILEIYNEG